MKPAHWIGIMIAAVVAFVLLRKRAEAAGPGATILPFPSPPGGGDFGGGGGGGGGFFGGGGGGGGGPMYGPAHPPVSDITATAVGDAAKAAAVGVPLPAAAALGAVSAVVETAKKKKPLFAPTKADLHREHFANVKPALKPPPTMPAPIAAAAKKSGIGGSVTNLVNKARATAQVQANTIKTLAATKPASPMPAATSMWTAAAKAGKAVAVAKAKAPAPPPPVRVAAPKAGASMWSQFR